MAFKYIQKIPEVSSIISGMPMDEALKQIKRERDREIKAVFKRKSDKFIVIVGPCSADNEDAVCEYVSKLRTLQDKVEDKLLLIPRIYTNKPRTTGAGYKGMAHQPDPNEAPNIVEGIKAIRKLHIRAFRESHLTAADEMLYPGNYPVLEDVLSYVAIGARSVENQQHRLTVSGLDVPIGMKNPTSGDLTVLLNSIMAAQLPHDFIYNGWEVATVGNPLAHAILRGAIDSYGRNIPNYHFEDLKRFIEMYKESGLDNPTVIVDTNHANSDKNYKEQPRIAMDIIYNLKKSKTLKEMVKGIMIESYIKEGRQEVTGKEYGMSITDACLGWEDSERLLFEIAEEL